MKQQALDDKTAGKRDIRGDSSEKDPRNAGHPQSSLRVLIVEDVPSDVELVLREMQKLDFEIVHKVVDSRDPYIETVEEFEPDIILSDYSMPSFDGMAALKILQEKKPGIPFIIVTGTQNEEVAVECMKAGAADYMIKENLRRLGPAVMAALEKYRLKSEKERAEEAMRKSRDELEDLVRERTAELEERNRKLGEEIAVRKRAEEEKKKTESQLAQAQRIESLGRFAGGIAHDLNNILYPIIINSEILLDESPPGTNQHELLEQTLSAAYRQRDLVKQILSFSRQRDQKLNETKVVPLLKDTLNFIRSTLPRTIEIRQHIVAGRDTIMGDPTQIQQVIMNLCRNAADALESEKGTIEVSLVNTRLDSRTTHPEIKPGEYLELKVCDTGHGMSSEVMSRIFEPFYTTKRVGKGSGMGLSVVHGILKNHDGAIMVESEPGRGSLFTVYLPLCEEKSAVKTPGADALGEEEKKKILLVDDEDMILSSLQRALEKLGYAVAACRDSRNALDLFENDPGRFDLVITDLTMPGMTGLTLTKRLIEIRPDIPIILCTGFSDVIDETQARSMGIRDLILKPSTTGELKAVVARVLLPGAGQNLQAGNRSE